MLCGQKKSLVVDSDMKALVETIDEGLKVLGKKRKNKVGDGHCLMWAWAKGFHILKSFVEAALSEELLSHGCHYAHFLSRSSLRSMLKAYLEEKIYREDDMDILLNALANAYRCKVILYQYRNQSIVLDTISPGPVESEKELELFYFNEHYELIFLFSETAEVNEHSKHSSNNEQFNGTFFEEHTTIETLPNSPNSTLSSSPKSISYLHENFQLPIFSERVDPFSIQNVYRILIEEKHSSVTCEQVPVQ